MAAASPDSAASQTRAVRIIASATCITSLSMTVWFPFLPLIMLQIGAVDEADAIFWVAVAQTVQGVARLIAGPLWGVVADRHGRKLMYVRTLYCGAVTIFIVSAMGAPWQLCIALGVQGLLSGFVPAAIALTSVTVPDGRLKGALSLVTGGQYLGTAIGPVIGAALALAIGYKGAIFAGGVLVVAVATMVALYVPPDSVKPRTVDGRKVSLEPFHPSFQLLLATFVYFVLFALNTFRYVATPIALQRIIGADATHATGIAFALGGIASAAGIWLLSGSYFRRQRVNMMLLVSTVLLAATHLLLAYSDTVTAFMVWFTAISLLNAGTVPLCNTLIALNVSRERRGTAFGLASGAQAVSFMAGPMLAAAFASTSLQAGFATLGVILIALAIFMWFALREPPQEPAV